MTLSVTFTGPVTISGLGDAQFAALMARIDSLETKMADAQNKLDQEIAALAAEVAAETTVEESAIALITGIPALIEAAVAKAQAAGATPDELTAVTALGTAIAASSAKLAAAVSAGTPPPPPPPAP